VPSRQMFTDKKDIQGRGMIFVPVPIVFQEQLQEKHAISTPISYFYKYFTAEHFEDYSKMTNAYVHFRIKSCLSLQMSWKCDSCLVHMYMGCDKLPRLRMYWSLAMDLENFKEPQQCL
jgi:hypothetical protein